MHMENNNMHARTDNVQGWGVVSADGSEVWDAKPIFASPTITKKEKLLLYFYPKKYFLFKYLEKAMKEKSRRANLLSEPFRILDVGSGTGSAVIEMKKMFGHGAEVIGLDVVQMQVDVSKLRAKEHGIHAEMYWYDGKQFPFSDNAFDAVYTSDVLGHVENVPYWLDEIHRVLRPGGVVAMFAESKLGKHAHVRNWLLKHGVNTDPHAQFHISLYSKRELKELILGAGFDIEDMYSSVWAKFLVHPDELYPALQRSTSWKVKPIKWANAVLYWLKKKTHPFSTAACELYSFFEMLLIGRWVESQGYVILAKSRKRSDSSGPQV